MPVLHEPAQSVEGLEARRDSNFDTIGHHMTRSMVSVRPNDAVAEACREMILNGISCIPVMEGNRSAGVINNRVLNRMLVMGASLNLRCSDVAMPAVTAPEATNIASAVELMRRNHVRHLIVTGPDGDASGLVSQTDLLEASRRQLANAMARAAEFETLASRDALTGLLSRRAFEEVLEFEFKRAERYGGLLALVFIDIDRFKEVNDLHGHASGDAVLRALGGVIRENARGADFAARFGGDEFVVLLPECGTRAAAIMADRIRFEFATTRFGSQGGGPFYASVSVGGCKWTADFKSPGQMIEEADRRLYEAKKAGGNTVVIAS